MQTATEQNARSYPTMTKLIKQEIPLITSIDEQDF